MLWALTARSCFLMPTKVTSNSLYERMKAILPPRPGGYRIRGPVYLSFKKRKEQEQSVEDKPKALRQYKAFMAPVMVATVDQLLTANPTWGLVFKELATLGAAIFDDSRHTFYPGPGSRRASSASRPWEGGS